jgi:anti-anti-sigma regulatory factor
MIRNDEITTTIEIPAYLMVQDLEQVLAKAMRKLVVRGSVCLIDMEKVRNVFSATIQLLLRIYDRALRLTCSIYIINASDAVCNALNSAGINEKISIYEKIRQPKLFEGELMHA